MKHPFDISRRGLLAVAVATLVFRARRALGGDMTTMMLGEEGGEKTLPGFADDKKAQTYELACLAEATPILEAMLNSVDQSRQLITGGARIVSATSEYQGNGTTLFTIVAAVGAKKRTLTVKKVLNGRRAKFVDAKIAE